MHLAWWCSKDCQQVFDGFSLNSMLWPKSEVARDFQQLHLRCECEHAGSHPSRVIANLQVFVERVQQSPRLWKHLFFKAGANKSTNICVCRFILFLYQPNKVLSQLMLFLSLKCTQQRFIRIQRRLLKFLLVKGSMLCCSGITGETLKQEHNVAYISPTQFSSNRSCP